MPEVISNTSCLLALSNIGFLDILHNIYGHILITNDVAEEFGEELPSWIAVTPVKDIAKLELINAILDPGEASSIALALEKSSPLLILDDGKARRLANNLNIKLTGTLGILVKAYKAKIIPDLQGTLFLLRQRGFYISKSVEKEIQSLV